MNARMHWPNRSVSLGYREHPVEIEQLLERLWAVRLGRVLALQLGRRCLVQPRRIHDVERRRGCVWRQLVGAAAARDTQLYRRDGVHVEFVADEKTALVVPCAVPG